MRGPIDWVTEKRFHRFNACFPPATNQSVTFSTCRENNFLEMNGNENLFFRVFANVTYPI